MSLERAQAIADAVLYEGYVLYPYRASAPKNRLRWQVGLITPRDYAEATGSDPWFTHTECLARVDAVATLTVLVRALHPQARSVEASPAGDGQWHTVDSALVGERHLISWDEAVVGEFRRDAVPIDAPPARHCYTWLLDHHDAVEPVADDRGRIANRFRRQRRPIQASVVVELERCGHLVKVRVRVANETPCAARALADRDQAILQSLAGTHVVLAIDGGSFVSLLEPAPADAALAATCVNQQTYPVLVGPPGSTNLMLSSPIILYDYPAVAPESSGDFFDATEIDELLTLRVQTLTDEEKREARATDERASRIIERCETATAESMRNLHGAVRRFDDASAYEGFLNPPGEALPEAAELEVGPVRFRRGLRVRVQPSRRADSMDICLRGRAATVTAVYRTLEDTPYIAVTLDDDPFGAAGERYRRALFFHPEELVPLSSLGGDAT